MYYTLCFFCVSTRNALFMKFHGSKTPYSYDFSSVKRLIGSYLRLALELHDPHAATFILHSPPPTDRPLAVTCHLSNHRSDVDQGVEIAGAFDRRGEFAVVDESLADRDVLRPANLAVRAKSLFNRFSSPIKSTNTSPNRHDIALNPISCQNYNRHFWHEMRLSPISCQIAIAFRAISMS